MVGRDVVAGRLARLDERVAWLEEHRRVPLDHFLSHHMAHATAERDLHVALECMLDIASHVVASAALGAPSTYREALEALSRGGVLPPALAARVAPMASLRNVLVHGYATLDLRRLHGRLQTAPDDLRAFGEAVRRWMDTQP